MDYFSILELHQEPFSNSPDPDFFFQSGQHQSCLQRLELALRLKRGLNVVIGDVGTGKTTLCRQLIRKFSEDSEMETHLILDPDFSSPADLLKRVVDLFEGGEPTTEADPRQLKERIKHALFQKGIDQEKTVALIIDEGQKIPGACLEPLREFLNYETNEYKLLQIVIFAQPEFEKTLSARPNFADRINLKHTLGPMNFRDTRAMIRFRLRRSSEAGQREDLFTLTGLWAVYRTTGGYPRKIIHLCHQCLLAVIIQNRQRAGWSLVRSCASRSHLSDRKPALRPALVLFLALVTLGGIAALPPIQAIWLPEEPAAVQPPESTAPTAAATPSNRTGPSPPSGQRTVAHENVAPPQAAPAAVPQPASAARKEPAVKTVSTADTGSPAPGGIEKVTTPTAPPPAEEAQSAMPPDFLGSVVLQTRETLWRLAGKVYGRFEPSDLESILEVNPQIGVPKKVEVGTTVRVPAIPANIRRSSAKTWWVRMEEKDRLEEAVDVLRRHPSEMPPIRIVPHWHPDRGLGFSIVLRETFSDRASAEYERSRLALSSQSEAELISGWADGTVFYADPYAGG